MIRETYIAAKKKVVPEGHVVIDIPRFRAKKDRISPFAPSAELLSDWNYNRIMWKDYVERYYQELRENHEAASLIEEIACRAVREDVWLVCLEKEYPCHRFLVKQIIERILVARGALEAPEDYSECYSLYKNLTLSEIASLKERKKRVDHTKEPAPRALLTVLGPGRSK
jgi:uncharacterized protein YeaO (DUF488 family)